MVNISNIISYVLSRIGLGLHHPAYVISLFTLEKFLSLKGVAPVILEIQFDGQCV